MTRRTFFWGLAAMAVVVTIILGFNKLRLGCRYAEPFVTLVPNALGGGFGITLVAGIIPLIWLAFIRFNLSRAAGPVRLWWVLAALMVAANLYVSNFHAKVDDLVC